MIYNEEKIENFITIYCNNLKPYLHAANYYYKGNYITEVDKNLYIDIDYTKLKYKPIKITEIMRRVRIGIFSKLENIVLVKLKEPVNSASIFGYGNTKYNAYLSGNYFKINQVILDYRSKKNGFIYDVVEININNRNLKFLASEIEYINPLDLNLFKGFTPKKDRSLKKGAIVKVVKNKQLRSLPKNGIGKVTNVEIILDIKYIDCVIEGKTYKQIKSNHFKVI